jgi:hypothetical protein
VLGKRDCGSLAEKDLADFPKTLHLATKSDAWYIDGLCLPAPSHIAEPLTKSHPAKPS